jgi:hypothetical protein
MTDFGHLHDLNSDYRDITGENLYLYASQITRASKVVCTFVSGNAVGLAEAEGYMRWALEVVRNGRLKHDDIIYIPPTKETQP